ncbi:hypothetical protein BK640_14925 [Pseudomonas protegens]|nr:hypothetical protein BK639_04300 [Pseudomonas protegens]ROM03070.1 hypothetical protein BK640_14925 [Pseudomonas protegens]ROM08572.1 hypothetical protein BK641_06810 [Pseudomonas protegens]ROM12612.1 hypothetical protein BK642_04300 [Pseudomonas protegens]
MKNRAKVRFSAGQTASVQFAVKVVVRRGAGSHFKGLKKHFKERLQEALNGVLNLAMNGAGNCAPASSLPLGGA